jgi:hypothetical protein
MTLYNVTFTNPFFADTELASTMPISEGRSINITAQQIADLLNNYGLNHYASFMLSGKADDFMAERGAWSQQVNGWFIVVKPLSAGA